MITASVWLTKLILSHLLTDFILQPKSWVASRTHKHFASGKLYLHGVITAGVAWAFIGWQYWLIALVILITHVFIDGWKSYQPPTVKYFLIDQCMHLLEQRMLRAAQPFESHHFGGNELGAIARQAVEGGVAVALGA